MYDEFLVFTQRLAQNVGDLLYRDCQNTKLIEHKGAVDLVTQFDRQSQDLIVKDIEQRYPDHGILSEEDIMKDSANPMKWIIDPLDGTTNFAHGLPIWSLSIALEREGDVIVGVVYDPTRQELFSAQQGRGAWLNGVLIKISTTADLDKALLVTGFPYDIRESTMNNLDHFGKFALCSQAVRRLGSAALDLCYTACGRFDGYWERKLSPWDQAAGSLIVKEAGGMITDFAGEPFSIYGDQVLATNGMIHEQMIDILNRRP
ncbi:inositol monophosphatase [candidate division WOR-3 bacterium]|nr:inositol monophosphatase [candidate division WOR-3 bacterium]